MARPSKFAFNIDSGEGATEPEPTPRVYSPSVAIWPKAEVHNTFEARKREQTTLAQHSSNSQEHYTPLDVVECARTLMGAIDLDPASSWLAQGRINASSWYGWQADGTMQDGLGLSWGGRVFLNPPGGLTEKHAPQLCGLSKSFAAIWWAKLVAQYDMGLIEQAVFVGFSLELLLSVQGTSKRHPLQFPHCIPSSRIAFDYPTDTRDGRPVLGTPPADGNGPWPVSESEIASSSGPTHGNFIVWLPPNEGLGWQSARDVWRAKFLDAFGAMGYCG